MKINELPTYIFIDASNIRNACKNSLYFNLDFVKLFEYFREKYPKLKAINYFEGIADDDELKKEEFTELEASGANVLTLSRKAYNKPAKYKKVTCEKCRHEQRVQTLGKSKSLKSNVDVFLCAELVKKVVAQKSSAHFLLLSCDGDFADMIKVALEMNPKIYFSVMVTPQTKKNNYLSIRLKELRKTPKYNLMNINNIRDIVEKRKEPHRGGTLDRYDKYSKVKHKSQEGNNRGGK